MHSLESLLAIFLLVHMELFSVARGVLTFELVDQVDERGYDGLSRILTPACMISVYTARSPGDFRVSCGVTPGDHHSECFHVYGRLTSAGFFTSIGTASHYSGADHTQLTGILAGDRSEATWICRRDMLQYTETLAGGGVEISVGSALGDSQWKLDACAHNPLYGGNAMLFRIQKIEGDQIIVCRFLGGDMPRSVEELSHALGTHCSPILYTETLGDVWSAANPVYSQLSDDGIGYAFSTPTRTITFNLYRSIDEAVTDAFKIVQDVVRLSVQSEDSLALVMGAGGTIDGAPTYDYDANFVKIDGVPSKMTEPVVDDVANWYEGAMIRAIEIDAPGQMVYEAHHDGSMTRAPLSTFSRVHSSRIADGVCGRTAPEDVPNRLVRIETFPVVGFALVFCGDVSVTSMASVRVAACTGGTATSCLTDTYYCTWYHYGQTCQLKAAAAASICAGGLANRCTGTVPTIGTIAPTYGTAAGGSAVVITVSVTLWDAPSLACVFGSTVVDASYVAGTVRCLTPAASAGPVTVNVRYLGVNIAPTSTVKYTYVAECTVDANCTARVAASNDTCTYGKCVNNACVVGIRADNTSCTAGNYVGYCVRGSCVGCLTDNQCGTMYPMSSSCIVPSCINNACGPRYLAPGVACTAGVYTGYCDSVGNCQDCIDDSDCVAEIRINSTCVVPVCQFGACRVAAVLLGTPCASGVAMVGRCDGLGGCMDCLDDEDCQSGIPMNTTCIVPVCAGGACRPSYRPIGTPCSAGIGMDGVCDSSGSCVDCIAVDDCGSRIQISNNCTIAACTNGTCLALPASTGTLCSIGNRTGTCTAVGECSPPPCADCEDCDVDADCDARSTIPIPCAHMICASHTCVMTIAAPGTPCVITGNITGTCNNATCVPEPCVDAPECVDTADCANRIDANCTCVRTSCSLGRCVTITATDGIVCTDLAGVNGTCVRGKCAVSCPHGPCANDSQCAQYYMTAERCVVTRCVNGSCLVAAASSGTPCVTGPKNGQCDGAGTCVATPVCATASDCAAVIPLTGNVCAAAECTPVGDCILVAAPDGTVCEYGVHNGTCTGGMCVPYVYTACVVHADCTVLFNGDNECIQPLCADIGCVFASLAVGSACSAGGVAGLCNGLGSCVPNADCRLEPPCRNDTECVEYAANRHGGNAVVAGTCRRWQCLYNGSCVIGLADVGTPCSGRQTDECGMLNTSLFPSDGETQASFCTASGDCAVVTDKLDSPRCTDGDACVAGACVPIVSGCATDSDCRPAADGCVVERCSVSTGRCVPSVMSDGSPCIPSASEIAAMDCSRHAIGSCRTGACVVTTLTATSNPSAGCGCTPDPACGMATCYRDGTCTLPNTTACSITPPACADLATVACNGLSQCSWMPTRACNDGNACTGDICTAAGTCEHSLLPTAECVGTIPGVVAIIAGISVGTVVLLTTAVIAIGISVSPSRPTKLKAKRW